MNIRYPIYEGVYRILTEYQGITISFYQRNSSKAPFSAFLATPMTRFCLPIGKTLPPRWQNFAIGVAKVCQGSDNLLAKYLPDIQGVANNRQQGMTNIPDSAGSPMPDWHLSHPAK